MQITALYASLLGLLLILLSYRVVVQRRRLGLGAGDGQDKPLMKAIRIHANFVEYVPIALILLMVLELNHGKALLIHISGFILVVARILHAQGMTKTLGTSTGRFSGILLTWLVITFLSLYNGYLYIASLFF